jgi:hypothetical protein
MSADVAGHALRRSIRAASLRFCTRVGVGLGVQGISVSVDAGCGRVSLLPLYEVGREPHGRTP